MGLSTGCELGSGVGLLGVTALACWGTGLLGGGGLGVGGFGFGGWAGLGGAFLGSLGLQQLGLFVWLTPLPVQPQQTKRCQISSAKVPVDLPSRLSL